MVSTGNNDGGRFVAERLDIIEGFAVVAYVDFGVVSTEFRELAFGGTALSARWGSVDSNCGHRGQVSFVQLLIFFGVFLAYNAVCTLV